MDCTVTPVYEGFDGSSFVTLSNTSSYSISYDTPGGMPLHSYSYYYSH